MTLEQLALLATCALVSGLLGFGLGVSYASSRWRRVLLTPVEEAAAERKIEEEIIDPTIEAAKTVLAERSWPGSGEPRYGGSLAPPVGIAPLGQVSPLQAYALGRAAADADRLRRCEFPGCGRELPRSELQPLMTANGTRLCCPKCSAFYS